MTTMTDPHQINIDAAIVVAPEEPTMDECLVTEEESMTDDPRPTEATTLADVAKGDEDDVVNAQCPEERSSSLNTGTTTGTAAEAEATEATTTTTGVGIDVTLGEVDSSELNVVTPTTAEPNLAPDTTAAEAAAAARTTTLPVETMLQQVASTSEENEQPASPFRGQCKYKSGKCNNERAKKRNGQAHTLCDYHRIRQNAHQRKSDRKHRESTGGSATVAVASGELTPEETLALVATGTGATPGAKKSKKRSYAKTTTGSGGQKEKEMAALHSLSSMQYQQQQKEAEEMVKKQRLVMMLNDENADHNALVGPDSVSNVGSAEASMEQLLDSSSVAALMMKEATTSPTPDSADPVTFKNMVIDI